MDGSKINNNQRRTSMDNEVKPQGEKKMQYENKFNMAGSGKRIYQTILSIILFILGLITVPIGLGVLLLGWLCIFKFFDAEVERSSKVGQVTHIGEEGILFRTYEGELRPLRVSDEKWKFTVTDHKVFKKMKKLHEAGVDVKVLFCKHVNVPLSMGNTNKIVYDVVPVKGKNEIS